MAEDPQIFSLEIQLGNLEFIENSDDLVILALPGVILARIQILKFPTIEITEDDFCNECANVGEMDFSKGKYVLLPIQESDINKCKQNFMIKIEIMKAILQSNLMPLMKPIGYTQLNLSRTFSSVVPKQNTNLNLTCPLIKLFKDQLEIVDSLTGSIVGTVCVYLRLQAYGKCIVTDKQKLLSGNDGQLFEECYQQIDLPDEIKNTKYTSKVNSPVADYKTKNNVIKQESKQLSAVTSNAALGVTLFKFGPSDNHSKGDEKMMSNAANVKDKMDPGSVYLGKDNIVFKLDENSLGNKHPGSQETSKITYGMKTSNPFFDGTSNFQQDQIQMIPAPDLLNINRSSSSANGLKGLVSGQPVHDNVDMYAIRIVKRNSKKNAFVAMDMEVRVPKLVKERKERFNRDVQYLMADIAPPEPVAAAKGRGKKKN